MEAILAYNLFIAYDLIAPGQQYDEVTECIMSLGAWHKFQQSLYYVHTSTNPKDAFDIISAVMDANDKLAVIDANSGVVSNWDKPPIDEINDVWFRG